MAAPATQSLQSETGCENRYLAVLILATVAVFIWSAIRPHDYFTWFLEVVPAIIGALILALTYKRFRFTTLVYTFIALHMIVLMVGGHYTYAEVPLFNWIRDTFHHARNNYDRIGHFMQGFVPALIARELFTRKQAVKRGAWMFLVVICACMAISAVYELFEWLVAAASGSTADAFLGSQGDPWDTQKDMATCLAGGTAALLFFSRLHDRMLARIR